MDNITDKQKKFCELYLIYADSTKAYKEIYTNCKDENARQCAYKLLRKDNIKEYINEIREQVYNDNLDTIEQVLFKLKSIYDGTTKEQKIYNVGGELVTKEIETSTRDKLKAMQMYIDILGYNNLFTQSNYTNDNTVLKNDFVDYNEPCVFIDDLHDEDDEPFNTIINDIRPNFFDDLHDENTPPN